MSSTKGKVILRLEMGAADAQRFRDAFNAGKFADLGIIDIKSPADANRAGDLAQKGHTAGRRSQGDSEPYSR